MKGILLLVTLLYSVSGISAWAGGFNLQSIGKADTSGRQISHWWYSGTSPTLRGEAQAGADVTISIDGTAVQVSADSAGDWVYTPSTELGAGDHEVILTSNGAEIKFRLTLGSDKVDW